MRILYTTARFPYPPLRGDQLTPYYRIQQLARNHEITLLSFVETSKELEYVRHLKPYCVDIHTVRLPRWQSYANVSRGALNRLPLQVLYYSSREYQKKLQAILSARKFDILHTVLSRPANYTSDVRGMVKVCEMIDTISLTMKRRADDARWPMQRVLGMEAGRMRLFEQHICKSFDGVVVVSEIDRQALDAPNVTVIPGGAEVSLRARSSSNGHKTIIFTGNLAYRPNEEAAIFLITEIWPQLRQLLPKARLQIVGNGPRPRLLSAARQFPGIEVTGFVPDLLQYLLEADVAVAPIRYCGGGIHNKALEALACGTPLVASSRVSRGVQGVAGEDFLIADSVPEYIQAICKILDNPGVATTLSKNGRRLVVENYSWEKTTQRLETLYEQLLYNRSLSTND